MDTWIEGGVARGIGIEEEAPGEANCTSAIWISSVITSDSASDHDQDREHLLLHKCLRNIKGEMVEEKRKRTSNNYWSTDAECRKYEKKKKKNLKQ